ncbi:MAG: T9SS type A sorting domain-containing protein [Cytophagaceae bacterium]|nr:MAG: T9SS type A sorting domain-containing protein [Cytophagaceae bacterium]
MGLDAAGNIYLGGHVVKEEAFSYDFFTIKFNAAGVYQWHQLYNGTANGVDFAVDFAVDAAGNVYITGESAGRVIIKNFVFNSLTDFATLKYNSAGVQQWVARYSVQATNSFDKPVAMTLDASGNVYVTGYSTVSGSNNANCTTVKYNSVGAQQWAAVFQGPAGREDYSADVHVDGSGNVFIGGTTINTAGNRDMIVVKYNPSGVQQWWGPYDVGAGYSESAVKGGIDAYGSFYLTGQTSIPGVTNSDIVTLKWTTNGVRSWVARYNSPSGASEHPNDMVVVMPRSDLAGQFVNANIFVTGSNEDPLTLKYSQPLVRGLASEIEPLPNGYAVGNHPNPFKSSTNITYELPDAAHVTINVFDVMGRKVSTLVNGNRSAGSYVQRFTGGKSTSGVYFYQFVVKSKTGEINTTRSMTIQR